MKRERRLGRRIAGRLVGHAARVLPRERAVWARAMINEIEYVAGDVDAVAWAIGCVRASYQERLRVMKTGTLRLSRWVLGLEMLVCFVPLSLLFATVAGVAAGGMMRADAALLYLSAAAAGPLGLIAAALILRPRAAIGRGMAAALGAAAAWTLLASIHQADDAMAMINSWQEFALIGLLPILGAAHLIAIAQPPGTRRPVAQRTRGSR